MRRLLLAMALVPACAPAGDAPVPLPPEAPRSQQLIEITSRSIEIGAAVLNGLVLRGTQVLSSSHPAFGGLSGIEIDGGRLYAVTDQGWWLEASLEEREDGIVPVEASLTRLLDSDGAVLDKAGGDAEGLAIVDGVSVISFERDHRIMTRRKGGRLQALVTHRGFEKLRNNSGMEALALLPDGRLLAIVEGTRAGGHPMFMVGEERAVEEGTLPVAEPFSVTGADVGPEGNLYVVLRHYAVLTGVSIEIHRFGLNAEGWPDPGSREVLASFAGRGGIDNMEGITVWEDGVGRTRITLISDDNFRFVQRTLLMDLMVAE